MSKKPLILGIESSCDETAAAIISENEQGLPMVLSNVVSSQVDVHKEFGGVVPELAARSHMEKIDWIVDKAIKDSQINIKDIDAIASTAGPGLIVCLSVGLSFGKALASTLSKPFIAVNHLEGHALSPKLNSNLDYPYLLLLISGGHSQFLNVKNLGDYKRLGTTIDDALGEAFDKTAKLLGIEFPGGPQIEILAKKGDPKKFNLQKPIVIADSGLLSKQNIEELKINNYEFILGARIKDENHITKKEILSLNLNDENNLASIKKDDLTLILSYTQKRAKKDKYNREKGLKRLEKTIKSGKLTKDLNFRI